MKAEDKAMEFKNRIPLLYAVRGISDIILESVFRIWINPDEIQSTDSIIM